MFDKRFTLFSILGFEVRVDPSWLILAVLITWTLAREVFPAYYPGLPGATYWMLGAAGAVGLFASILFHELCHSYVARGYGVPMKGITLFIFGGVAEMDEEPPSPKAEFMMAVAGPVSSIALAVAFLACYRALIHCAAPPHFAGIARYLGIINAMLAAFNLLPGFPLDGGRVLRSLLWSWKGNLRAATRVASTIGTALGTALFVLGILNVLGGNVVGGIWWLMIGMFLRSASQMSYRQVLARRAFEGVPLRRFMRPDPVTVPASASVERLVEDYVYRYHFKLFPVVEGARLVGCVSTRDVKGVPRGEWGGRRVGGIAAPCSSDNTVSPDDDAMHAIAAMNRSGNSRLMVVEGDRLVGIVTLKDMLKLLALKLDLEGDG